MSKCIHEFVLNFILSISICFLFTFYSWGVSVIIGLFIKSFICVSLLTLTFNLIHFILASRLPHPTPHTNTQPQTNVIYWNTELHQSYFFRYLPFPNNFWNSKYTIRTQPSSININSGIGLGLCSKYQRKKHTETGKFWFRQHGGVGFMTFYKVVFTYLMKHRLI